MIFFPREFPVAVHQNVTVFRISPRLRTSNKHKPSRWLISQGAKRPTKPTKNKFKTVIQRRVYEEKKVKTKGENHLNHMNQPIYLPMNWHAMEIPAWVLVGTCRKCIFIHGPFSSYLSLRSRCRYRCCTLHIFLALLLDATQHMGAHMVDATQLVWAVWGC